MESRLAVVIPTLNEEDTLGGLLADLLAQRGVELEVVVADGGSRDATRAVFERAAAAAPAFVLRWVSSKAGRGAQMNMGAALAAAPDLLFLHADSRLPDPDMLSAARAEMDSRRRGADAIGGHFGLEFAGAEANFGLYWIAAKSRRDDPDCINGDQGQWLARELFEALGRFDESLPILEDARLSRALGEKGRWVSLPGRVSTSPRRFEAEGFFNRVTLNALIRNFDNIERPRFFEDARALYRDQSAAGTFKLGPFMRLAHRQTLEGWPETWMEVGTYVRNNAWQLAFMIDCRRNFKRGLRPGDGPTPMTGRFIRAFDIMTDNPLGRAAAAVLTMLVFYPLWGAVWIKER